MTFGQLHPCSGAEGTSGGGRYLHGSLLGADVVASVVCESAVPAYRDDDSEHFGNIMLLDLGQ